MNEFQLEKFILIKKVVFGDTCAHMECTDNFILPTWNSLNYRSTDTDAILEAKRKNCYFYALCKVGQSSMFLHSSSHYKSYYVHVDEISNFSVRELMWVDQ